MAIFLIILALVAVPAFFVLRKKVSGSVGAGGGKGTDAENVNKV